MGEIGMAQLEFATRARDLGQSPPEPPLDSSLAETNWGKVACFGGASEHKEEKLAELRLMDIETASFDCGVGRENMIRLLPELPFNGKAVAHKLAVPWLALQDKCFVQTLPRKVSISRRWRRVRRQSRDNPLQLNIDLLVLTTGYSLGIIGLKTYGDCNRKRVGVKDFGVGGTGRKIHRRAVWYKKHASSVESYMVASDAGDAFSKHRQRKMLISYDGDRSEDRQSEEVQSAYKRDTDVDEEMVISEEQNDENDWNWVLQDKNGGALAESISSLHTTQQVLESEIQKLSELSKEFDAEESSCGNKDQDVIVLPHAEVDVLGMNEKMEHLEQKLKEASNTIREKDLRLSRLQILISSADMPMLEKEATDVDQLEMELEHHLQEKIQAEIQCLVMMKTRQNWQVRAEDQIALEEHKSSARDTTKMLLKLRETENKIIMLKEVVDKLEVHEKELYGTTEVLKMQNRTFKLTLFGLIQLIMLCLALKMFFAQAPVHFGQVVPT